MNDYDTSAMYSKKLPALLYAALLETPLGSMLAIGYEKALCYLTFVLEQEIEHEINQFASKTKVTVHMNKVESIISIEKEFAAYFQGKLVIFKTPCHTVGTSFQQRAWDALRQIPFAQTRSYKEQAVAVGNPSACRAVAGANSANPISIVIPCHRIINSNGNLGGYAGGIDKKQWLLQHEKKYI